MKISRSFAHFINFFFDIYSLAISFIYTFCSSELINWYIFGFLCIPVIIPNLFYLAIKLKFITINEMNEEDYNNIYVVDKDDFKPEELLYFYFFFWLGSFVGSFVMVLINFNAKIGSPDVELYFIINLIPTFILITIGLIIWIFNILKNKLDD